MVVEAAKCRGRERPVCGVDLPGEAVRLDVESRRDVLVAELDVELH